MTRRGRFHAGGLLRRFTLASLVPHDDDNDKGNDDNNDNDSDNVMIMIVKIIVTKEREKIDNYCDFKYEIRRIRNCRSGQVIPIVVGALGTVSRGFRMWLRQLRMPYCFELLQRITVFGSGLIL